MILETSGTYIIAGGDGDDCIVGGGSEDELYGNHGNDVLFGGSGSDYLSGGNRKKDTDICINDAGSTTFNGCANYP